MTETQTQTLTIAPQPYPLAPAPWTTKAETYWLMLHMPDKLPERIYDPLEASSAEFAGEREAGRFKGGLGVIMIVRYSNTPVGPYDELLIIPGVWDVPGKKMKRKRIARIYVSQEATTFNGRTNWNIPKHLARFSFSSPPSKNGQSPPHSMHIAVYPPGDQSKHPNPFFSTTLTPFRMLPAVPFSTTWLPLNMQMAQPPIPASTASSRSGPEAVLKRQEKDEKEELMVGTDKWSMFAVVTKSPRARGMWVEVHSPKAGSDEEREARKWWPQQGVRPFRVGGWFEDCIIDIDKPVEWKL